MEVMRERKGRSPDSDRSRWAPRLEHTSKFPGCNSCYAHGTGLFVGIFEIITASASMRSREPWYWWCTCAPKRTIQLFISSYDFIDLSSILLPLLSPKCAYFGEIDVTVENEAFSEERASAYDLGKVVSERALRSVEWSAIYNS